jgi:hypothetical protein
VRGAGSMDREAALELAMLEARIRTGNEKRRAVIILMIQFNLKI